MDKIQIIIKKNHDQSGIDISSLVKKIVWSGRKGKAARTINVSIVDSDNQTGRSNLDIEEGYSCIFYYNNKELFSGLIMGQTQSIRQDLSFTAYDYGIYLKNKDTFVYENKTADKIFLDICQRFGLKTNNVAKCGYKIPNLTKRNSTAFDVIQEALSLEFKATGVRHYITCDKGQLSLIKRQEHVLQWAIEYGKNLLGYSFSKSIENVKTRIKLVSKEGTVVASKTNPNLEKKYGIFQEIEKVEEGLTEAQVKDIIDNILNEKGKAERSLPIEALGIPDVISGVGVFINIPKLKLNKTFYVDEDTHIFEDNKHTMSLTLNFASDIHKAG